MHNFLLDELEQPLQFTNFLLTFRWKKCIKRYISRHNRHNGNPSKIGKNGIITTVPDFIRKSHIQPPKRKAARSNRAGEAKKPDKV